MRSQLAMTEEREPGHERPSYAVPPWVGTSDIDVYSDTLNVNVGMFGVTVAFGQRAMGAKPDSEVARVFMSFQMAEVFRRMLTQLLDAYQIDRGPIYLPEEMLQALGISDEGLATLRERARAAAQGTERGAREE